MLTWKAIPNSPELVEPCVVRILLKYHHQSKREVDLYWWTEGDVGLFGQFPECLHLDDPDTDWRGPFETEQEAINDCREQVTA